MPLAATGSVTEVPLGPTGDYVGRTEERRNKRTGGLRELDDSM